MRQENGRENKSFFNAKVIIKTKTTGVHFKIAIGDHVKTLKDKIKAQTEQKILKMVKVTIGQKHPDLKSLRGIVHAREKTNGIRYSLNGLDLIEVGDIKVKCVKNDAGEFEVTASCSCATLC